MRSQRINAEISATLLARQANINRSRYSFIECGHVKPTDEELERLETALNRLLWARRQVKEVAEQVGWPMGAV